MLIVARILSYLYTIHTIQPVIWNAHGGLREVLPEIFILFHQVKKQLKLVIFLQIISLLKFIFQEEIIEQ